MMSSDCSASTFTAGRNYPAGPITLARPYEADKPVLLSICLTVFRRCVSGHGEVHLMHFRPRAGLAVTEAGRSGA